MCRSGVGTNLKYIDKEDLSSEKVRVRTAAERAQDSEYNVDPDADDMGVLKSRSPQLHSEGAPHRLVSKKNVPHTQNSFCYCSNSLVVCL
jgi:hypothetical protein